MIHRVEPPHVAADEDPPPRPSSLHLPQEMSDGELAAGSGAVEVLVWRIREHRRRRTIRGTQHINARTAFLRLEPKRFETSFERAGATRCAALLPELLPLRES